VIGSVTGQFFLAELDYGDFNRQTVLRFTENGDSLEITGLVYDDVSVLIETKLDQNGQVKSQEFLLVV